MRDLTRKELVLERLRAANGGWVDGPDLANAEVGGSEGLKRLRELRAEGYPIEMRAHPDHRRSVRQYRLTGAQRLDVHRVTNADLLAEADLGSAGPVPPPPDMSLIDTLTEGAPKRWLCPVHGEPLADVTEMLFGFATGKCYFVSLGAGGPHGKVTTRRHT